MNEESPIPWQELIETLFRHWRGIAVGLLLGLFLALAINAFTPPIYRAKSRILLTAKAVPNPREEAMEGRQIQAEMALLRSPALIRGVLDDYFAAKKQEEPRPGLDRLLKTTIQWGRGLFSKVQAGKPTTTLGFEVQRLSKELEVRLLEGSNLVEVAYASHDPEWAAGFVNDLLAHHVSRLAQSTELTTAGTFFQEQRSLLAVRWEEARAALAKFRQDHGASQLAGDPKHVSGVLSKLETDRVSADTEVLELEAKISFLTEEITRQPTTIDAESRVTENVSVRELESRILELEIERSELLSRYTATSVLVRNIDRRIEEAKRLLETKQGETLAERMTAANPTRQQLEIDLVQTRSQLVAAQARRQALDTQITTFRQQMSHLETLSAELERYEDDVESAKATYQSYLKKEEDARLTQVQQSSGIVNVSIFEKADVPVTPEPDKKNVILIAGSVLGLVLGMAVGFVRDLLDPMVKSSAQAHRVSGLPIVAEIPGV